MVKVKLEFKESNSPYFAYYYNDQVIGTIGFSDYIDMSDPFSSILDSRLHCTFMKKGFESNLITDLEDISLDSFLESWDNMFQNNLTESFYSDSYEDGLHKIAVLALEHHNIPYTEFSECFSVYTRVQDLSPASGV